MCFEPDSTAWAMHMELADRNDEILLIEKTKGRIQHSVLPYSLQRANCLASSFLQQSSYVQTIYMYVYALLVIYHFNR